MGFIHDRIAEAGHDVEYLCADDVPADWDNGLGQRLKFPLMVRRHVIARARAGKPYDIVNVHEPSAAPVAAWRGGARSPAVIVTSHGLQCRQWELAKQEAKLGREGPGLKARLTYPMSSLWPVQYGLRRADHVFCLNFDDRDYLIQACRRRIDTVTRIFPAADVLYAQASARRDYSRCERLLFAGTWRKNKGVEDLIPAFVKLAEHDSRFSLIVVGPGVPAERVRGSFPESMRGRICCYSPDGEDRMASAFAEADLFLLPSLFEGTPLTLMQAMMSGLPIVTTNTCGMKDVIVDDVSGRLVPIRSPQEIVSTVQHLASDCDLRARLGRAARAEALQHYTWDRVATPVQQVYERLYECRT